MKKLHFLSLVAVALLAVACNSKTSETTTSIDTAKSQTPAQPDLNNQVKVSLDCRELKSMDEGDGVPLYEISLVINGQSTPVDSATACGDIGTDMYDQYHIPANAQQAVGGWFAGGGDYYYLKMEGTDAVVMYGWADEGAEPGTEYQYQEIKRLAVTPGF